MANQVDITGTISRPTTVIATQGVAMALLHIATGRQWQGADGTTKHAKTLTSVVCFGDLATEAVRIGVEGRPVAVNASLRTRQRTDGDGTKRYDLQVIADAVHATEPHAVASNHIQLTGTISRDTTVIPTQGVAMALLHIAADRQWQGADGTTKHAKTFTSVVCFGDLATEAARIGVEGRPVAVNASLGTRQRTDGDGTKRYDLQVIADTVRDMEFRSVAAKGHDVQNTVRSTMRSESDWRASLVKRPAAGGELAL